MLGYKEKINKNKSIIDDYSLKNNIGYYNDLIHRQYEKRAELEKKSSIAFMGEIVVSTPEKPIVGTSGLATCNGIVFYDRNNKKAWVGHGPASSSILTLRKMLDDINGVTGTLEYAIIPGWDNMHNNNYLTILDEMISYLYHYCPKNIRLTPMNNLDVRQDNRANPSYEFAFNAETGENVTQELFYEDEYMPDKKM